MCLKKECQAILPTSGSTAGPEEPTGPLHAWIRSRPGGVPLDSPFKGALCAALGRGGLMAAIAFLGVSLNSVQGRQPLAQGLGGKLPTSFSEVTGRLSGHKLGC